MQRVDILSAKRLLCDSYYLHDVGKRPPARSRCCPYSPEVAQPVGTACSSRWRRTLVEPVGETVADAEQAFEPCVLQ